MMILIIYFKLKKAQETCALKNPRIPLRETWGQKATPSILLITRKHNSPLTRGLGGLKMSLMNTLLDCKGRKKTRQWRETTFFQ
jgi:hypothetical protein